ncbi:MAG: cytochrome c [Ignavibacteria bacterium]|nr:cytochrome c [Ignavibacteria bacterium]
MDNLKNNLNKLRSDPGKIFGFVYPYILFVIIALGILYITNLGNIARQSIPLVAADTTKLTDLPVIEPRTVPPINIIEISQPTQELIAQGKEAYTTICASCHGEDGRGSGPASTGLNPPPRNFTNKEGWKNSPKIAGIYTTLEQGIPGSGMIAYNYLPPSDRIALAHYIRQTFVPDPPVDTESELTALDQLYFLSQGKEIPAQIPVETAMNLIMEENSTTVQTLVQKVNQVNYESDAGARVFNSVTSNKLRALTTLNSDNSWKQDYQKFVRTLIYNVNSNGFNNNIFRLSSDEWNALYNYMNRLF